jgi:hypothetical protein
LLLFWRKGYNVNLSRILGLVTLIAGSSVLLGDLAVGQQRLFELTGIPFLGLRPLGVLSMILGAAAIYVGILEERESNSQHDKA